MKEGNYGNSIEIGSNYHSRVNNESLTTFQQKKDVEIGKNYGEEKRKPSFALECVRNV